ncbi:hypothetical protein [Gelidibacter japonicus]|uniref:hypothetical protein n=1 Tax=Gelidibacter japonicus TaxID=1962232 RepID=UPI002AFE78D1|nr:hypothetical protein [Gelidibacter japonicus]
MTFYNRGYKDGFQHGVVTVIITLIFLTIIYLLIMKATETTDPIQAYLNKQQAHQNYLNNSDASQSKV